MSSVWKQVRGPRFIFAGIALGTASFLVSFSEITAIQWLVGAAVMLLSFSGTLFLRISLPILCCFVCFEGNISQTPDVVFLSPHSTFPIGSLWPLCLAIFLVGNLNLMRVKIPKQDLSLVILLAATVVLATFYFTQRYGVNVVLNKEPIKLLLFISASSFFVPALVQACRKKALLVESSVIILLTAVATHRFFSLVFLDLKDVGAYNYLVVPLGVWLGWKSWQTMDKGLFWFALIVLLASFRVSRTEIALVFIMLPLFFSVSRRYKEMIAVGLLLSFATGWLITSGSSYGLYFLHKTRFFLNLGVGELSEIGLSALVRVYEFLNLFAGYGADFMTVAFGRGLFGFINFDVFFNPAIFSEDSFSETEFSTNMFFRLHFFLNELLFNFGIVGTAVLCLVFLRALGPIRLVSFAFIVYLVFNGLYRVEILFLIPFYHRFLMGGDGAPLYTRQCPSESSLSFKPL